MTARMRADRLLVSRGLFATRASARAAIEAGLVLADGAPVAKPAQSLRADAQILATPAHPYVSRGALKLEAALSRFGFDPTGKVCIDVGASTGGFTEVLLNRGARRVYAVDAGSGQLHPSLRDRPEVILLERTDVRSLDPQGLPDPPTFAAVDVSFISLKLVLPAVFRILAPPAELVALIKPQFEVGKAQVRKGVVRDPALHAAVCADLVAFVAGTGWSVLDTIESPILGGDGNREFLLGARRS